MATILKRNEIFTNFVSMINRPGLNTRIHSMNAISVREYRFPTYEITLMAHGECENDITKQFGGWIDSKLSAFGVEQAKRAGKIMSMDESQFHVAYTSEMERAHETCKLVLEPLSNQTKVFATWRLNDRHMGDLTGYNRSQMALVHGERKVKEWIEEYSAMPPIIKVENPKYRSIMEAMNKKRLTADQIPRAESMQMVYNRVLPYWENMIIPSLKMRNKVIVIAHSCSLCALIRRFAELSDTEAVHVSLPPAIPFTFTLDNHMKIIKGKGVKQSNKTRAQFMQAQNPPQPVLGGTQRPTGTAVAATAQAPIADHFYAQQQMSVRGNDDIKSRN